MVSAWLQSLTWQPQSQKAGKRLCNSYFEVCFAEPNRVVSHYDIHSEHPDPKHSCEILVKGSLSANSDREIFAAMYLWTIEPQQYQQVLTRLREQAYATISYQSDSQ
jgi:hypothetical protein